MWIRVKYEKLQDFCYKCGIVDHDFRDCEKERVMSLFSPENPMYGSWLGVPLAMFRRDGEIVEIEEKEESVEDAAVKSNDVGSEEMHGNRCVSAEDMELDAG